MALASLPPAAAAGVAALLPRLTPADGAWLALGVAIAEQQIWGYAAARNAGLTRGDLAKTMLLNVVLA